jgi:hypothetical protein
VGLGGRRVSSIAVRLRKESTGAGRGAVSFLSSSFLFRSPLFCKIRLRHDGENPNQNI